MRPCALRRLWLLTAGVLVLDGCRDMLPTAPSELTEGVIIYQHANYLGASAHIVSPVANLQSFDGPCQQTTDNGDGSTSVINSWDDCISSIRVALVTRCKIFRIISGSNTLSRVREIVGGLPQLDIGSKQEPIGSGFAERHAHAAGVDDSRPDITRVIMSFRASLLLSGRGFGDVEAAERVVLHAAGSTRTPEESLRLQLAHTVEYYLGRRKDVWLLLQVATHAPFRNPTCSSVSLPIGTSSRKSKRNGRHSRSVIPCHTCATTASASASSDGP